MTGLVVLCYWLLWLLTGSCYNLDERDQGLSLRYKWLAELVSRVCMHMAGLDSRVCVAGLDYRICPGGTKYGAVDGSGP